MPAGHVAEPAEIDLQDFEWARPQLAPAGRGQDGFEIAPGQGKRIEEAQLGLG
jgi:hypothetical protein